MFKKILYPIDISCGESCQRQLQHVLQMTREWDAALYLVYVIPDFGMPLVASFFPADAGEKIRADATAQMARFVEEHVSGSLEVHSIIRQGAVYAEILAEAEALSPDLIVVPDRDRSDPDRWLLGSNASKIVHHAQCPVLVLRGKAWR